MPKNTHRPSLHIDILKPQSEGEPLTTRLLRFLLSTGRFIIIFVEIIVLAAFVSRFKLDSDLQTNTENINRQIPVIESLKIDEQIIRQTQLQLATIYDIKQSGPTFATILQKISAQTPTGVKLITISLEKSSGKYLLKINGTASTNADLSSFVAGLRSDSSFTDVSIANASLEQNAIVFTLGATIKTSGGNSL